MTSSASRSGQPLTHDVHGGVHDDFGGLVRDQHLIGRRRALGALGLGGLAAGLLAACGGDDSATADPSVTSTTPDAAESDAASASGAGTAIPDETAGPYPADGSNGPNVLTDGAVVRADLTTSFGDYSGTADGIPTTVEFTVVDAATGSPLPGTALYLWHCTADGRYSLYETTDQNYLRGVQAADDAGRITFQTVFPGCYAGRWPHMHFEVFESLDDADAGQDAIKTSQLALPEASCVEAYADGAYGSSSGNLGQLSLQSDGIFRDGWTDQLATVAGSADDGYVVSLLVRV